MLESRADSPPPEDDEDRGGIAGGLDQPAIRGCAIALAGLVLMVLAVWVLIGLAD